ncbi:serine protease [Erythrobacter sp. JK5]|uniref:serine protease n=1 Tax=Erythrobacter sp. JK5 TaxID=2829500 RepID=UPI001BADCB24|nr:serine protease [Erythrobacter sp. JK5]QUL37964.1 serine protease [Erythrobacter sp. JK5]
MALPRFLALLAIGGLSLGSSQPEPPEPEDEDRSVYQVLPEDEGDEYPPKGAEPIILGSEAPPGAAPWQVQIYSTVPYTAAEKRHDATLSPIASRNPGGEAKKYLNERNDYELNHRCGGAYLGELWIVTAAHCVAGKPFVGDKVNDVLTDRRVRMGTQSISGGGATYPIDAVVIHRKYEPGGKSHDIALIRITTRGKRGSIQSGRLKSIRLFKRELYGEASLRARPLEVYGWGVTGPLVHGAENLRLDKDGKLQRSPSSLHYVGVTYLSYRECRKYSALKGSLARGMICGLGRARDGEDDVFSDSCRGDSGGPLITKRSDGTERLVGLVSWGKGCGMPDMPGVYVDVSHYSLWIETAKVGIEPGVWRR